LTVSFGDGRGRDELTVDGLPDVPVEANLVLRAFAATRRALGAELPPLVAHLEKRIPMQAGLGGGSSDAAAAVDAALQMWRAGLAPEVHAEIALALGSDVPFFVRGGHAALVAGRGDEVVPLDAPPELGLLLVTPRVGLSTSAVFARFDDLNGAPRDAVDVSVLGRLPVAAAELRDANALWPAAVSLAPKLATMRAELEDATGLPWLMSGSGSTLFALYPSAQDAAASGRAVVAAEPTWLTGALVNAVSLAGPDPIWRYPWLSEQ
jgi:4-diphosphocytidyl-2-C-methyl-D-erythritol kinase